MSTNARSRQNRTGIRPNYFEQGINERDARHVADTVTTTGHIIHPDGSRGRRHLHGGTINDYVDAVANAHGWAIKKYGLSLADHFLSTLDGDL